MIDRCVRCGYSLKGLPTVHRCPECGRENDRESTVVREPRLWARVSVVLGSALMFAAYVPLVRSVWAWRAMIVLPVPVTAWVWIKMSRRGRMVVVSRRFLELIDEASKVKSYSMEKVADARWSFVTGRTKITDRQGRVIVTIPNKFFSSLLTDRKVVRAIRVQVARRESAELADSPAPAE